MYYYYASDADRCISRDCNTETERFRTYLTCHGTATTLHGRPKDLDVYYPYMCTSSKVTRRTRTNHAGVFGHFRAMGSTTLLPVIQLLP